LKRACLAIALLLSGCIKAGTGFQCSTDTSCNGGTCEPTGFCSFADATCEGGRRYGSESGPLANQCVGGPPDAPAGDAPADAAPVAPVVVAHAFSNESTVDTLTYQLGVPAGGTKRYLLVSVHLASDCNTPVPDTTSVTFDGVALAKVTDIVGTPCGNNADTFTRTEQWNLIAPSEGAHDVVVTLSAATPFTIHSAAIAMTGVNQSTPVRGFASATSAGTTVVVAVPSAPGDLVIDTAGTGGMFTAPDADQTQVFVNNISTQNTMNNSASSTRPGAGGMVAFGWTGIPDVFQDIATSIRP
jgi:hypothetical protein